MPHAVLKESEGIGRNPTRVTFGSERVRRIEAGPFAVSVAAFPAGYTIPSHYHPWGCVSLILQGRFLQRFPGRECDCPSGFVLAKPPLERHEDRWFAGGSRHLIIEVDPARHEELGRSRSMVEQIHHLSADGTEQFTRRMLRELGRPDDLTPVAVQGLTLQLLAFLSRRGGESLGRGGKPAWLRQVREHLHDHFSDEIRLACLARMAGVHPDHLARTFAGSFGQGIGEYVRELRLQAAMAALATTDDSIASIALRCGFSDQSHLTRLLRRTAGLTPAAYRARSLRATYGL